MTKQNGNGGVILDRAKAIADEMRATALKLAEQGRALAKAAREATEELEEKSEQLGAKAVEVFDELAHEAIVKIERSTAALQMIAKQQEALVQPVEHPQTQAVTEASRAGTGAVEQSLQQMIERAK